MALDPREESSIDNDDELFFFRIRNRATWTTVHACCCNHARSNQPPQGRQQYGEKGVWLIKAQVSLAD